MDVLVFIFASVWSAGEIRYGCLTVYFCISLVSRWDHKWMSYLRILIQSGQQVRSDIDVLLCIFASVWSADEITYGCLTYVFCISLVSRCDQIWISYCEFLHQSGQQMRSHMDVLLMCFASVWSVDEIRCGYGTVYFCITLARAADNVHVASPQ